VSVNGFGYLCCRYRDEIPQRVLYCITKIGMFCFAQLSLLLMMMQHSRQHLIESAARQWPSTPVELQRELL